MDFLKSLNEYAGLLALLALLAAIIVPFLIYKIGVRDKKQEYRDELEGFDSTCIFPMSSDERDRAARRHMMEKALKK